MVALTGHSEGYYCDYLGSPQEFISAAKYGYLYQGQWYSWHSRRRGRSGLDLPLTSFVNFIQNHDQIANSARGLRAHKLTSPGVYRALTALTLLLPGTPMLFQGQEFASSAPFLYFADHEPELAALVQAGRAKFLSQFPSLADERMIAQFAVPHDPETFHRCKLDFSGTGNESRGVSTHQRPAAIAANSSGLPACSSRDRWSRYRSAGVHSTVLL